MINVFFKGLVFELLITPEIALLFSFSFEMKVKVSRETLCGHRTTRSSTVEKNDGFNLEDFCLFVSKCR